MRSLHVVPLFISINKKKIYLFFEAYTLIQGVLFWHELRSHFIARFRLACGHKMLRWNNKWNVLRTCILFLGIIHEVIMYVLIVNPSAYSWWAYILGFWRMLNSNFHIVSIQFRRLGIFIFSMTRALVGGLSWTLLCKWRRRMLMQLYPFMAAWSKLWEFDNCQYC